MSTEKKSIETLLGLQRIAVVGFSSTPEKPAYTIPRYLMKKGYTVFPVNPHLPEKVAGERSYPSILDIQETVDLVVIFRPSSEVFRLVEEIVRRGDVQGIWMQENICSDRGAQLAREKGLLVVQNRCIYKEHQLLLQGEGE